MSCHRCGKDVKDQRAHERRVHPEEYWWKPEMPAPHQSAVKITLIDNIYTREGHEVIWHEWRPEEGEIGWFMPIEPAEAIKVIQERGER